MTTNVGLVTSDAVVLGCDSIASASSWYIDPIRLPWVQNPDGTFAVDGDGKYTLKFNYSDFESVVTDAWGGVTKMFEIHPSPSPMVAITAGLAKLQERPIASWAAEFCSSQSSRGLVNCGAIARTFLKFMRSRYMAHYKGVTLPDNLKEGPEFLIGGYGRDDQLPSLFRVKIKENECIEEYGPHLKGPDGTALHSGLVWNGQADAVERFIRGTDTVARASLTSEIGRQLKSHAQSVNEYVSATVNAILDKLGATMPAGIDLKPPELSKLRLNWSAHKLSIGYANMPLQEAVNFVAFLVNLQSGRSRFARGVGTVGGRTHVGIITKDKGFKLLNEPELVHKYTGLGDDL